MFIREKIAFPFHGRTRAIDIAGRRLHLRAQRSFDDLAVALEFTARPGHEFIRVPLGPVQALEQWYPRAIRSICVHWDGLNDPTYILCKGLTTPPAAAASKLARWCQWSTSFSTWARFEPAPNFELATGHIVLHAPGLCPRSSIGSALWAKEALRFSPWSTTDRPHLWPEYALYGGASGELILYIMHGQAHGRFKLAKKQLEDFKALGRYAQLQLGFYNPDQRIDTAIPIGQLRLPLLKNEQRAEPYYVIDVNWAKEPAQFDQLRLPI